MKKRKLILLLALMMIVPNSLSFADTNTNIQKIVGETYKEDKEKNTFESDKAIVSLNDKNEIENIEYKDFIDVENDKESEFIKNLGLGYTTEKIEPENDLTSVIYKAYDGFYDPYNRTEIYYYKDSEMKEPKKQLQGISVFRQKTIVTDDIVNELNSKNINDEEVIRNAAFKQNIELGYFTIDAIDRSIELVEQMIYDVLDKEDTYTTIVFTLKGKNKNGNPVTIGYDYINDKIYKLVGFDVPKEEEKVEKEIKEEKKEETVEEEQEIGFFAKLLMTIKKGFNTIRNLLPF